jgi:murein L,D-transpeptidase YcbB/YkuD
MFHAILGAQQSMTRTGFQTASALTFLALGSAAMAAPPAAADAALGSALARYQALEQAGGWPMVEPGPALRTGMKHARVLKLKQRLRSTGDLVETGGDPELFDEPLFHAVTRFQRRLGLAETGIADARTIAELNIPVRSRIAQIATNLERSAAGGEESRYIHVNVPENRLRLIENGRVIHSARVVVGKPATPTPSFRATMTYLEVSPYWNVPYSILARDLLPRLRSSPGFLAANGYELMGRGGPIDPNSVDWYSIASGAFPFGLRQRPGPGNALGRIVFMFPNAHNVFIHDTPQQAHFAREQRFFSNGCIRVEDALKLAEILLREQDNGSWSEGRLLALSRRGSPHRIELETPVPVHIEYLTAWAGSDGEVHFRRDVYGRDGKERRNTQFAVTQ